MPLSAESTAISDHIWHFEARNSTAIEGNTLVLREVEALLDRPTAVGAKDLKDYLGVLGYGEVARWVYAQATAPEGHAGEGLVTITEVRSVHQQVMLRVWDVAPHPDATREEGPGASAEIDIRAFDGGMRSLLRVEVPERLSMWVDEVNLRLKLAAIRRTAPEVLISAKAQRWTPEEVLRTLIESELTARNASNIVNRRKAAAFPVTKTLESFDVAASSIQPKVFDYLYSLEWVRAQVNLAMIGHAGTGKSHTLIGLGVAAVHAGHKVRYFTAADLVETLYRGLADNTVGKIIESLLRVDLIIIDEMGFAPLDDTGTQLLFRLVAGAYERRSLAIGSHWPFEQWGRFLLEHTTAASILDRLLHHATSGDFNLAIDTSRAYYDRKRAEGKKHNAALICLARRRCDVLFAMLKNKTLSQPPAAQAA